VERRYLTFIDGLNKYKKYIVIMSLKLCKYHYSFELILLFCNMKPTNLVKDQGLRMNEDRDFI